MDLVLALGGEPSHQQLQNMQQRVLDDIGAVLGGPNHSEALEGLDLGSTHTLARKLVLLSKWSIHAEYFVW